MKKDLMYQPAALVQHSDVSELIDMDLNLMEVAVLLISTHSYKNFGEMCSFTELLELTGCKPRLLTAALVRLQAASLLTAYKPVI